ncbi:MAG: GTP-binding protein [Cyanobacteria bacterium REEB67]|nr:GTP-binding protein [Cyanobacteria bacterium REEB67]
MNSEPTHPGASVSLTILTGFLGAGKTSLVKRILTDDHGLRVAVIVNDFGAINIDADLIVSIEENVVSLANGCVCCSIRDDLAVAIEDLIESPQPPEYIILEASGIADPAGITITFSTGTNYLGIQVDTIVCVVDAEQFFANPEHMQLKLRQIAAADLVLLNKIDLVNEEQIDKIGTWLHENFRLHRVIKTTQCDVPMEILLSAGRFDPARSEGELTHTQEHAHECDTEPCSHREHNMTGFKSWSYETRSALSLGALEQVVRRLPVNVYRCKGILNTAEAPDRQTILQVVGKRVSISDGGSWHQAEPISRIVVIASNDEQDLDQLKNHFDQCLACLVLE